MAGPVKDLFRSIIEETRRRGDDGPTTLISVLLAMAEKETDSPQIDMVYPPDHIIGECFSWFAAGGDTTANTLGKRGENLVAHV